MIKNIKLKKFVVLILILIALAPISIYFFVFPYGLSNEVSDWAAFGSYVGGVYGSMAFFAVAYSIYITVTRFIQQNEDNIFYRSIDDLTRFIDLKHYTDEKSGSIISAIVDDIYEELRNNSSHLARRLLCKNPAVLTDTNISNIVRSIAHRNDFKNKDDFFREISSSKNFNECWEKLKGILGGVGEEDKNIKEALRAAGSVSFYKVDFEERLYYYELMWDEIEKKHGEFINRYTRNLDFILSHINDSQKKDHYIQYLKSRFSKYDIVLIFYFAAIGKNLDTIKLLNEFDILDEIQRSECRYLLLDSPSKQQALDEKRHIMEMMT